MRRRVQPRVNIAGAENFGVPPVSLKTGRVEENNESNRLLWLVLIILLLAVVGIVWWLFL